MDLPPAVLRWPVRAVSASETNSLDEIASATASPFMGSMPDQKAAVTPASAWRVTVHKNYAELEALWRRMETEGHCTIFQTFDWAACWYDTATTSGDTEPLIILVSKEESPVWILPLCIHRKKGLSIITFADLGVADYTAPVMARGAPADRKTVRAMLRAVLDALPRCDAVNFEKISEKVDGIPNPLLFLNGMEIFSVKCHGVRLFEPWPKLSEKIMQRRLYSVIKRQRNKITGQGEVAIEHHNSPETLAPVLENLMELRRARFGAIGLPDMPPIWKNFYRQLVMRQRSGFQVSITTLSVSGESIATCFGLTRGNTYYAILPTFKIGKWERFRPGMLLFDAMLTSFAEKTGGEGYFDFTVGDENYKKRFGAESHLLYEWMAPRSVAGLVPYATWRAKAIIRRCPRLYKALKDGMRKIRGGGNGMNSGAEDS